MCEIEKAIREAGVIKYFQPSVNFQRKSEAPRARGVQPPVVFGITNLRYPAIMMCHAGGGGDVCDHNADATVQHLNSRVPIAAQPVLQPQEPVLRFGNR
jgi:hypothetical protein